MIRGPRFPVFDPVEMGAREEGLKALIFLDCEAFLECDGLEGFDPNFLPAGLPLPRFECACNFTIFRQPRASRACRPNVGLNWAINKQISGKLCLPSESELLTARARHIAGMWPQSGDTQRGHNHGHLLCAFVIIHSIRCIWLQLPSAMRVWPSPCYLMLRWFYALTLSCC